MLVKLELMVRTTRKFELFDNKKKKKKRKKEKKKRFLKTIFNKELMQFERLIDT